MQHVYEAPLSVDFEMEDAKEEEGSGAAENPNNSRYRKNAVVSRYGSSASLSSDNNNLPRSTSFPVLSNIDRGLFKSRKVSLQDDFTYQRTSNPFILARKKSGGSTKSCSSSSRRSSTETRRCSTDTKTSSSPIQETIEEVIDVNETILDENIVDKTPDNNNIDSKYRRSSHFCMPTNSQPIKTRPRSNTITINIPPRFEDLEEECDDYQFVDVRDEILLIKDQFDQLLSVLDDGLFGSVVDNVNSKYPEYIYLGPTIKVQLFVVMGIAIGHILDGTVLAYTSTAIPSIESDNVTFSDPNEVLKPFIYSAHSFGATIACILAGIAMSTLGRRGATLLCTVPCYLIGYIVIGMSSNYITLILGRFLTGLGLGMTLTIPNVYIVEVTSPEYRGVLGVLPNLFCQLGIFITYVVGQWLDWSQLALAFAALNALFFVAVYYIPESPCYLLSKGQEQKAENTLNFLDIDLAAMATMQLSPVEKEKTDKQHIWTKMSNSANYKPFISGIILMGFFQATAYPILIGNTVTLFQEADETVDEKIASIIVGMAIVVTALISIPLAKKCDRKTLLGISALGVSACLFTLGTFYYLKSIDGVEGFGWLPLVDFMVYIGFFMSGYGSVSWLVFAELLPPAIRPTAYPLGIAIMWFVNFILTTLYEPLLTLIGTHGFLWTYASISSLGCIFIAICLPETRGKTPFEIADFYEAKSTKNSSKYTAQASNIMRKINFPQFRRSSSSANSLK